MPAVGSSSSSRRGLTASATATSTTRWSPCASLADHAVGLAVEIDDLDAAPRRAGARAMRSLRPIQALALSRAAVSTPTRMFSKTVRSGRISVIWNVRTIPLATR